jgi:hypothetical protein
MCLAKCDDVLWGGTGSLAGIFKIGIRRESVQITANFATGCQGR